MEFAVVFVVIPVRAANRFEMWSAKRRTDAFGKSRGGGVAFVARRTSEGRKINTEINPMPMGTNFSENKR
jgi:hypothetical protein